MRGGVDAGGGLRLDAHLPAVPTFQYFVSMSVPRLPRWPSAITALVLVSWLFATPPLRNVATGQAPDDARLVHSVGYLVLAPVCNVMDALTLLSVSQTLALIASLALLYVAWRCARRSRWQGARAMRAGRELLFAMAALGVLVGVYALAVLAPRPMAAIALDDPDLLAVDFHSHTNASHDGRAGFTAQENREWHRAAGFDVAYITDHKSYAGALQAARTNPVHAGEGVVLLSGLEFVREHNHLNALGVTATNFMRPPVWHWAATDNAASAPATPGPVLIQTVPDHLELVPTPDAEGRGGVLGIELSDGSPRGIEQLHRDRARILRIADSLDLAVVAGSDNHGWGHTAVAWSVLRIPGWRALSPAALGKAIEYTIRTERRHAGRVIGRRSPDPGRSAVVLAATLPAVAVNILVTLSPGERLSWLLWSWGLAAMVLARAGRRDRARAMLHDVPLRA